MTDTAALAALAKAATPGPWTLSQIDERPTWVLGSDVGVVAQVGFRHSHDAAYIAAVSPDVLLDLLAQLDRAEAVVVAARVAHDAWFGGLIDSDYDRMAAIFDDLRAALAALDGTAEEQVRAALRAYEDADKVAGG